MLAFTFTAVFFFAMTLATLSLKFVEGFSASKAIIVTCTDKEMTRKK